MEQDLSTHPLQIRRLPQRLTPDPRRTIIRFFWVGGANRARKVIDRVINLSEAEVGKMLESTLAEFGDHHPELHEVLTEHYQEAIQRADVSGTRRQARQLLIGAYFTMEYAFESAALFNPSMVPTVDQDGLEAGSTRFLMSLRAVGEGHISSIVFRLGVITADGEVQLNPVSNHTRRLRMVEDRTYAKADFRTKFIETGAYTQAAEPLFEALPDTFTCEQLRQTIDRLQNGADPAPETIESGQRMLWLAQSNYQIITHRAADLSQYVVFPLSEAESMGMEDMRLVRFVDDDGSVCYYGTYTAYNGSQILPQLMHAVPGQIFEVDTLHGQFARNKGIALFPRRIDGQHMMIGRTDGENLFLVKSHNVHFWNDGQLIQEPKYPWEFVQIGNCGSPIETDAGWLLLTHGVGPMRRYCMGATLLDLDDPARVIGQLTEPLLMPAADERSGYVPNVVYSCGAMVHNGILVIPYGISDAATGFATVNLDQLLGQLHR